MYGVSIMLNDLWPTIAEYSGPHGRWKYTCTSSLNSAINVLIKSGYRGDDLFTDKISLIYNYDITDKRKIKFSLRDTNKDYRFISLLRFIKEYEKKPNEYKDYIKGAIIHNKHLSQKCIDYVNDHYLTPTDANVEYITKLYLEGHYDTAASLLFTNDSRFLNNSCKKVLKYLKKMKELPRNDFFFCELIPKYITPRECYFGYKKLLGAESTIEKLVNMYTYEILDKSDDVDIFNTFIRTLERIKVQFIPKKLKVLVKTIMVHFSHSPNNAYEYIKCYNENADSICHDILMRLVNSNHINEPIKLVIRSVLSSLSVKDILDTKCWNTAVSIPALASKELYQSILNMPVEIVNPQRWNMRIEFVGINYQDHNTLSYEECIRKIVQWDIDLPLIIQPNNVFSRHKIIHDVYMKNYYPKFMSIQTMEIVISMTTNEIFIRKLFEFVLKYPNLKNGMDYIGKLCLMKGVNLQHKK